MAIAACVASTVLLIFVLLLRRDIQQFRKLEQKPEQPATQHAWWWHLLHRRGHA